MKEITGDWPKRIQSIVDRETPHMHIRVQTGALAGTLLSTTVALIRIYKEHGESQAATALVTADPNGTFPLRFAERVQKYGDGNVAVSLSNAFKFIGLKFSDPHTYNSATGDIGTYRVRDNHYVIPGSAWYE